MLKIVTGRAGTGKTAGVYSKMKELAHSGENGMLLIVPEQFSHEAERELCRVCGNSISLRAEVISFSRLCSRAFSETGGLSDKVLDEGGRVLLMSIALRKMAPSLKVYNLGTRRPEFIRRLITTRDEFKAAGVTLDTISEVAEKQEGAFSEKLRDLYMIFTAYEAAIPENMCDPYDRLERLSECIEESSLGNSEIFIDGFTDFTAQELSVVERLLIKCKNMTVCLTCDGIGGRDTQFETARTTAARLLNMASRNHIKVVLEERTEYTSEKSDELQYLEKYLLADMRPDFNGEKGRAFAYEAGTKIEECELAAAKALGFVRREKCRWRDIAVAVSDWNDYKGIAPGIFEKYGVPFYTYDKEDIMQKPVVSLISAALDIISGGWEYEDVFRYLKTSLTGMELGDRDILENYVYKWNIRGSLMWSRDEDWIASPDGYEKGSDEKNDQILKKINSLRKAVSGPLSRLETALEDNKQARDKVKAIYRFTEDIDLCRRIGDKVNDLRSEGSGQQAEEYSQLWGILVSAMEQCAAALGETEMENEEFFKLFKLLLSQYDVGTIPVYVDTVGIGDMSRMRRRNIKHLILLGASDDKMPSFAQGEGVLTDMEKDLLTDEGLELSNTSNQRIHRQMESIYSCVTQPSETLTVSYASEGGGGRPSFVFTGICAGLDITPKRVDSSIKKEAVSPCFELAAAGDAQAREYFNSHEKWRERLDLVTLAASVPRGRLERNTAMRLYSNKINVTASRVDKYYSCKFAYFMQYGLKAKPRNRIKFEAPETGTFVHFILENVTKDIMDKGSFAEATRDYIEERVNHYASIYVDNMLDGFADKSKRFIYLFGRIVRDTTSIVCTMAEELSNSDFVPVDFELDFSAGGDMPPASVEDEQDKVTVSGKVDRVDGWVHDGKIYLRVVDYKTGRKEFSLSDVLRGIGLQMLIYLFVLEKKGIQRYGMEVVPAGVLYMPAREIILDMDRSSSDQEIEKERGKKLRRHGLVLDDTDVIEAMEHGKTPKYIPVKFGKDGSPSGDSLADLEKFGALSKHIDKMLLDMGKCLGRGEISADPYFKSTVENACMYCDFYDACHFGDDKNDRKRYASRLKSYDAWKAIMDAGETEGK